MYPAPPVMRVVATVGHCTVRTVSVAVVVTYSAGQAVLDRCVDALRAGGGIEHIVVVDTGGAAAVSGDGIELIRMHNRGYGAAANVGFAAAVARVAANTPVDIALLNDDVIVRPGWLAPLVAELRAAPPQHKVGAAQPKLIFAGTSTINSLGVQIGPDGAGTDIGLGEADTPALQPTDLQIFSGGAVLFNRDFLQATGGFDERYVLYYEDVDLALRGRELGWSYRLVPASVVEHVGSLSTASAPARTRYLQERNRLLASFRFADPHTQRTALWLSVRRLRHRPRRTHARALLSALWLKRSW
jgi:N-acetylglucosaminyl-diphospho-decaprenol L-rhamnosyltransferase